MINFLSAKPSNSKGRLFKELEEEKKITNSQARINDIDESIYNTNQSIEELRKYERH